MKQIFHTDFGFAVVSAGFLAMVLAGGWNACRGQEGLPKSLDDLDSLPALESEDTSNSVPNVSPETLSARKALEGQEVPSLAEYPEIGTLEEPSLDEFDIQEERRPMAVKTPESAVPETTQTPQTAQSDAALPHVPLVAASFNGAVPGTSTLNEATEIFGKPTKVQKNGGGEGVDFVEFQVEGFRGVGIIVSQNIVQAVVVDLTKPVPARELAKNLEFEHIQSFFNQDEKGVLRGEIFPENGVSFAYDPSGTPVTAEDYMKDPEHVVIPVVQVIFQPISAQAFLMRAETWLGTDDSQALADIRQALLLEPGNPAAEEMLKQMGKTAEEIMVQPEVVEEPEVAAQPEPQPEPAALPEELPETLDEPTLPGIPTEIADAQDSEPVKIENRTPEPESEAAALPEELVESLENGSSMESYSFEDSLFEKVEKLAQDGNFEQAMELLNEIRTRSAQNPFVLIRADLLEGDILMILPTPSPVAAFKLHYNAVREGEFLLNNNQTRGGLKIALQDREKLFLNTILLDAYVGLAADIANRNWKGRLTYLVPWLERADKVSEQFFNSGLLTDSQDILRRRYRLATRSLAVGTLIGKDYDARIYADRTYRYGRELLENVTNPEEYYAICYKTSLSLDDAAKVCLLRGEDTLAETYLSRAAAMMNVVREQKSALEVDELFLLAQLYYHTGQIDAWRAAQSGSPEARQKFHEAAVAWYEKSLPCLMDVIKTQKWTDLVRLCEIVNGMSVSYWEIGDSQRTLAMLKTGIFLLERHVADHPAEKNRLAVPYRNMIRVSKYLNMASETQLYEKKLAGLN